MLSIKKNSFDKAIQSENRTAKKKRENSSAPNSDATAKKIMSTLKPDYFITYNGLPDILTARNRRLIAQTKDCQSNQQALKCERNRVIKESMRNSKQAKDLINDTIRNHRQSLSQPKCASADNSKCNRNVKR